MKRSLFLLLFTLCAALTTGYGQEISIDELGDSSPAKVNSQRPPEKVLSSFKEGKKYGLKLNDSIIAPAIYNFIDFTRGWFERPAWIQKDGKYGLLLNTGQELIPCMYEEALDAVEHSDQTLYRVKLKGKYGIVNRQNQLVIPASFDYIITDLKGFVVKKDTLFGLYTLQGKEVIPPTFQHLYPLYHQSTVLLTRKQNLLGLVDFAGNTLHAQDLTLVKPVTDAWHNDSKVAGGEYLLVDYRTNYVLKNKKGKSGVFNTASHKMVIPEQYEAIYQELNAAKAPIFIVKKKGKFGIINHQNQIVLPFAYDSLYFDKLPLNPPNPLDQYELVARKKGKLGLITLGGKEITGFKYTHIQSILHHLYKVETESGGYAIINAKGGVVQKGPFTQVGYFANDKAAVYTDQGMSYLSPEGKLLPTPANLPPHQGFATLEEMNKAFVEALMSPDDDLLRQFAQKVSPSHSSLDFLKRLGQSYRGIPNEMRNVDSDLLMITDSYYNSLLHFKDRYFTNQGWKITNYYPGVMGTDQVSYDGNVKGIEYHIVLEAGGTTLEYKLGELLLIDGHWISFTKPRKI